MRSLCPLLLLLAIVGCDKGKPETGVSASAAEPTAAKTYLLYIKIPEKILPLERGKKYEDPINDMLTKAKLGEVSGGGTMLTKEQEIEYVGVDIDTPEPEKTIPLLISKLKEIGAPPGTVIEQYEPVEKTIEVK